jgi:hypothetical protein
VALVAAPVLVLMTPAVLVLMAAPVLVLLAAPVLVLVLVLRLVSGREAVLVPAVSDRDVLVLLIHVGRNGTP